MNLVDIGDGFQLDAPAANAYLRARAAGCPAGITSAYRSAETQQAMRTAYLAALRRGEHPTYVAAVEDSEHVTGNALDLWSAAQTWMRAHPDYGFVFTDSSENWHVAYRFANDRHVNDGTSLPVDLTPLTPEEPMFKLFRIIEDGRIFLAGPDTWRQVPTMGHVDTLVRAFNIPAVSPGVYWRDIPITEGQQLDDVLDAP